MATVYGVATRAGGTVEIESILGAGTEVPVLLPIAQARPAPAEPDPDEALKIVLKERPQVVLTDVVMPGMAGTKLAERVRELAPEAKIVFMSGYSEDVVLRNGLARGDLDFLHKRFAKTTLERAVSVALRG